MTAIPMWDDLTRALCLMLVFEGLLPAVAPARWQETVSRLGTADPRVIRQAGVACMLAGAGLLYLVN